MIHGDFSLDQVIQRKNKADEIKLHILDWDRSAYADPFWDLASFQERLELQVIEGVLPRWQAQQVLEAFWNSYQKKSEISLDGLYWYVASAMLRLTTEPFRKRSNQWAQHTLQLLKRIGVIMRQASHTQPKPSKQAVDFGEDFALHTLTDVEAMQA